MSEKKYLCAKEVAKILGVSTRTAQRLMRANEIGTFRVGAWLLRTSESEVGRYVSRQCERYRRSKA